jgi:hypothetical protein
VEIGACFQNHIFGGSGRFAQSVWTAAASAPLLHARKFPGFSKPFVRPKARLKPAQSRRFATLADAKSALDRILLPDTVLAMNQTGHKPIWQS